MSGLTLMAVHAHPDDEASLTGGILARYAREGVRTVLVTCTNGELGDAPGGLKPDEDGHEVAAVVATRMQELKASCDILGITDLELLGYQDSGMMGWPQNDAPGSFWSTPVVDAATRLAALMERYRPDVVVTYDENGFYGHPDHIQANRITHAAMDMWGTPAKLYYTAVGKKAMEEMFERLRELAPDAEAPGGDDLDIGIADELITTVVDTSEFVGVKRAALAAHASQLDSSFFLEMPEEIFNSMFGFESFTRQRDHTGASTPEDDLFAGLR